MLRLLFLTLSFLALEALQDLENDPKIIKWIELTAPYNDWCMKEFQVSPADIEKVVILHKAPSNRKFACYLNCLYEALGLFDDHHQFKQSALVDTFFYINEDMANVCTAAANLKNDHCTQSIILGKCIEYKLYG
ncbi:hypothetical protein FQA39_LY10003 [Lamprigera yunnana]|nr:hypothetical protein FQA39_LY10003 [Lamprigera yunnana]